jgi:hypothetical protein
MAVKPIKTPFTNMSFTPDIPSAALAPEEYNVGQNIETDVRGINSVAGDELILNTISGNAIFTTSGFRNNNLYWFITATREGNWYAQTTSGLTNVTPTANTYISTSYTNSTPITSSWSGDTLIINDSVNPPMYLTATGTEFALYSNNPGANVSYQWNYNPSYTSLRAGFVRLYASPNVGSLLIAGNLQADTTANTVVNLPTTVRWSQAFGLNQVPLTWSPTLTNVANELEVPVRGPVIDGFPIGGNFFVCSYWDTVIFSPIAYTVTTAPVFGVRLVNQGRGLLNENCWANADDVVYGLDARDIWVFNGGNFKSLGNQRVKNYFYSNLNPTYANLTFLINNTAKNQIEIYYADLTSTGHCNKMLAYRYDLNVWQPPRDVTNAVSATEAPIWSGNTYNIATRTIVYAQGSTPNSKLVQKDQGTSFLNGAPISTLFERNNISFGQPYSNKVQVHRILPEVVGTGNVNVTVGGSNSVGANITYKPTVGMAIDTDNPWCQIDQNDQRVVSFKVATNSNVNSFTMTAVNWQVTIIEDDR